MAAGQKQIERLSSTLQVVCPFAEQKVVTIYILTQLVSAKNHVSKACKKTISVLILEVTYVCNTYSEN